IGLWLFPMLIGKILDSTNTQLVEQVKAGTLSPEMAATQYNYTAPLIMLACLGIAALVLGIILKRIDQRKGLGLELPNIKK
ncbi:MAG: MFS transporter, partial [Rikenellaceae bacterium]|nr:MFS transporter [Rikenellaceae bacterium]